MKCYYHAPIGLLEIHSDPSGLNSLLLADVIPDQLDDISLTDDKSIQQAICWLNAYFNHEPLPALPDFSLSGTPFQKLIWKLCLQTGYGDTSTYKQLADHAAGILGKEKMSAQAVGQALKRNPVMIMIPCHRIIGLNQKLTGYGGSSPERIQVKQWLLDHEQL